MHGLDVTIALIIVCDLEERKRKYQYQPPNLKISVASGGGVDTLILQIY